MDNAVIIAANTVSEDVHIQVHANLHIQVNFNERMDESKVSLLANCFITDIKWLTRKMNG